MSRDLGQDRNMDYSLGETISFDHEGTRLEGTIVRVYNTRMVYHVQVGDRRFEVLVPEDELRRVEVAK